MNTSSLQFHPIHGEHIKLLRNNTVAKRTDSFCKGICFSNRTIKIREKIYVRLLSKSVQWTGFLRLGVTTCDPDNHRASTSLPRHACPDLTCRPGYWAKCVPENCFDLNNKLTYFYVHDDGELLLNTPSGEISLLSGISVQEPLWALLDIYGNCISIELVTDAQVAPPLQPSDPFRIVNETTTTPYFKELSTDLSPLTFLSLHSPSISFYKASNTLLNQSIILFDSTKDCDGIAFFSAPLTVNSGVLIQILNIISSSESRTRSTTITTTANLSPSRIQFGLTNCNTKELLITNELPLNIDQINNRSEFWIIQDFKLGNKTTIDRDDEFLFTLNQNGVVEYSHNDSKLSDFIHIDSTLTYYPFLVFKSDIVAIRSIGYIKNLERYRSLQVFENKSNTSRSSSQQSPFTDSNGRKDQSDVKLNQDCTVCFDKLRDTVLIPCGHICLCYCCAEGVIETGSRQCPICRSPIKFINKVYLA